MGSLLLALLAVFGFFFAVGLMVGRWRVLAVPLGLGVAVIVIWGAQAGGDIAPLLAVFVLVVAIGVGAAGAAAGVLARTGIRKRSRYYRSGRSG